MIGSKITQKDISEWCSTHECIVENCEYMADYCHIREYMLETCNECTRNNCHGCLNYK